MEPDAASGRSHINSSISIDSSIFRSLYCSFLYDLQALPQDRLLPYKCCSLSLLAPVKFPHLQSTINPCYFVNVILDLLCKPQRISLMEIENIYQKV